MARRHAPRDWGRPGSLLVVVLVSPTVIAFPQSRALGGWRDGALVGPRHPARISPA